MILADKIINERKKNGWSQEELAEKLSVSRQSVSKWEGAQSVPDLSKVLQMANLFGVSTDYLLKDEIEPEVIAVSTELQTMSESEPPVRKVSMEEVQEFLSMKEKVSPIIATAVSLFILCPVPLIFMAGLTEYDKWSLSDTVSGAIGLITLLLLVAIGVALCMIFGSREEEYKFLETEDFETEYGVTGLIKEKKAEFKDTYNILMAVGVIMCILSPVPLLIAAFLEAPDFILVSTVCLLLIIVATAVHLFIRIGSTMESYQLLLREGEYTLNKKRANKKMERISSIYWSIILAIYLLISFTKMNWGISWVIWPVAGVFYAAVEGIAKGIVKVDD